LSCQHIVFTNGPSLTGKTTAAGNLGCSLGLPVLATHEHGSVLTNGVLDLRKRLGRYAPLFARTHPILSAGDSVILDAGFLDYARRAPLYALACHFGAQLIAIRTNCDDLELIRVRAQQRAMDPNGNDRDVGFNAHLLTLNEVLANPLEQDAEFWELGGEIIEFNTGHESYVACAPNARADTRMIASVLDGSGLLAPLPACSDCGRRCR